MSDAEDKKHDPGERQLREAAERGELPRSPELSAVAGLLAVAAALTYGGASVAGPILDFAVREVPSVGPLETGDAVALLHRALEVVAAASLPPLAAAGLASGAVGLAQTRFSLATRAFEARLEHLDPFATFGRIYMSKQPFVELAKGALHVGALGGVTAWAIAGRLGELPRMATAAPTQQLDLLVTLGWDLVTRAFPVMLLLAGVDYAWSYRTWWTSLMRTDQEARQASREQDGDPHVKAQRRRRMRELATNNAMKQLATADVLITNPTHYAIGLRYRHGVDAAPVVVVKGVDHVALKLRQEAFRLGIPRVEDRVLARTLHATVQAGKPVPPALFGPVAKVLAVIWRRRRPRAAALPGRAGPRGGRTARAPRQGA